MGNLLDSRPPPINPLSDMDSFRSSTPSPFKNQITALLKIDYSVFLIHQVKDLKMFSKSSLIWSLVAQHPFPNYSIISILHSLLSFAFFHISLCQYSYLAKSLWPFTYPSNFLSTGSMRAGSVVYCLVLSCNCSLQKQWGF